MGRGDTARLVVRAESGTHGKLELVVVYRTYFAKRQVSQWRQLLQEDPLSTGGDSQQSPFPTSTGLKTRRIAGT
jgi:hypothetical protein